MNNNMETVIKNMMAFVINNDEECKYCDINLISQYWKEVYEDMIQEPKLFDEIIKKENNLSYEWSPNSKQFLTDSITSVLDKLYVYDGPRLGYITHKNIESIEEKLNNKNIKFNKIKDYIDFLKIDNKNYNLKIYVDSPYLYLSVDYKNAPLNQHSSFGFKYVDEDTMITDICKEYI